MFHDEIFRGISTKSYYPVLITMCYQSTAHYYSCDFIGFLMTQAGSPCRLLHPYFRQSKSHIDSRIPRDAKHQSRSSTSGNETSGTSVFLQAKGFHRGFHKNTKRGVRRAGKNNTQRGSSKEKLASREHLTRRLHSIPLANGK